MINGYSENWCASAPNVENIHIRSSTGDYSCRRDVNNVPPPPEYLVPTEGTGTLSKDVAATFMRDFWYCENPLTVKQKYIYISKIFTNMFIDDNMRAEYMLQLCRTQRRYFALMRFVRLCKLKKAKVQIHTDLCMDELSPKQRRTFVLFQNGRLYYFSLNDLAKILINAITHSSYLFLIPIRAKNPYNNMEFTKADLYNIYFQMKSVFLIMPRILELYFLCNFDIYALKKHHETELFHIMVDNYVKNSDTDLLLLDYEDMLKYTRMYNKIRVDDDYPKEDLIKTMRPFIRLFLIGKYVCDSQLKHNYDCELEYRLRFFHKTNPLFGRKIVRAQYRRNRTLFNIPSGEDDDRAEFMEPSQIRINKLFDNFMDSHIYAEYNYNSFITRGFYNDETNIDNYGLMEQRAGYQPVFRDTRAVRPRHNTEHDDDDNISASISLSPEQVYMMTSDNATDDAEFDDEDTIIVQDSDSDSGDEQDAPQGYGGDDDDESISTSSGDEEEKEEDYDW